MNYWCYPGIYDTNSVEGIIYKVCSLLNVERELLFTNTRKREIVVARQLCMWLIKKNLDNKLYSLHRIGNYFNKDHATVLYAFKAIDNLIETNKSFRNQINTLL